jgi:hypothetical protein
LVFFLDNEKCYYATVAQKIKDHDVENHSQIKFLVKLSDGEFDKIMAYGILFEFIEALKDEYLTLEHKAWILY